MKHLKGENASNGVLLWRKDGTNWSIAPVDDQQYDEQTQIYYFRSGLLNPRDKTFYFTIDDFSHSIEIIESTISQGKSFKVKIAPITNFIPPQQDSPNVGIRLRDELVVNPQVPLNATPDTPNEVFVKNKLTNKITIKSVLDNIQQNDLDIDSNKKKLIGTLSALASFEFYVVFTGGNVNLPYRFIIAIKNHQPMIECSDKGYTHLEIYRNGGVPNNINITIQPDIP